MRRVIGLIGILVLTFVQFGCTQHPMQVTQIGDDLTIFGIVYRGRGANTVQLADLTQEEGSPSYPQFDDWREVPFSPSVPVFTTTVVKLADGSTSDISFGAKIPTSQAAVSGSATQSSNATGTFTVLQIKDSYTLVNAIISDQATREKARFYGPNARIVYAVAVSDDASSSTASKIAAAASVTVQRVDGDLKVNLGSNGSVTIQKATVCAFSVVRPCWQKDGEGNATIVDVVRDDPGNPIPAPAGTSYDPNNAPAMPAFQQLNAKGTTPLIQYSKGGYDKNSTPLVFNKTTGVDVFEQDHFKVPMSGNYDVKLNITVKHPHDNSPHPRFRVILLSKDSKGANVIQEMIPSTDQSGQNDLPLEEHLGKFRLIADTKYQVMLWSNINGTNAQVLPGGTIEINRVQ